jgi:hypothetical protein
MQCRSPLIKEGGGDVGRFNPIESNPTLQKLFLQADVKPNMTSPSFPSTGTPVSWWSILTGDGDQNRMPSKARTRSRSSSRGRSRRASERTPLLRRITERNEDVSPAEDANVLAAEVAQQGQGGPPEFPELRKSRSRSFSHGQLVAPQDDGTNAEDARLVRFQENGLLEGVSVWKFRCIFGGIVMGYFVSRVSNHIFSRVC